MNFRHFVFNIFLFIDSCLYLHFQACYILKSSVTINFFGLDTLIQEITIEENQIASPVQLATVL